MNRIMRPYGGDKVRAFDDAYASRLAEIIQGKNPGAVREYGQPSRCANVSNGVLPIRRDTNTSEKAPAAAANYDYQHVQD